MDVLLETALKDFHTSGITNKAIQKDGVGQTQLVKVILNYPQSLHLLYEVESSTNNNQHFSVNGQLMAGLQNGYAAQLHFTNIANIVPPNFTSLPYSSQQQILQQVFDKADCQIQCDCGSFYWQGMFEEDDKKSNTYSPFTGQQGTGEWQARHGASGNAQGQQLCKHTWSVIEQLDNDIPAILKMISGTTNQQGTTTSNATSTTTADDTLQAPETPAGVPDERPQSEMGIKSTKAADAVSDDIDEIQSTAEQLDLPKMETTEVKTKPVEAETEIQEGPEDAEPPVEEPSLPANQDDNDDDMSKEVLDEPLENRSGEKIVESQLREKYVPIVWDSRKKNVVDCNTGEPISGSIMKSLRFTTGKRSWKWAKPNEDNETLKNAENYIINIAREADEHEADSFLIMHKDGITPAGGVAFYKYQLGPFMDEIFEKLGLDTNGVDFPCDGKETVVNEIALIGFIQNDITLVKDVLALMNKMLDRYPIIEWTVHNENPVKRAYDKMMKQYNGKSDDDGEFTRYTIACPYWRQYQKPVESLREEYIPLDYDRSIQKVINRDTGEPFDNEYMRDLMRIRGNKSWYYAKPHQNWISNGEEYIIEIAKDYRDGDAETFLITHEYGITPVGGIAFYLSELSSYMSIVNKWLELPFSKEELEGQKFVSEIALIGFRENDFTLVKDCFNLVDKMLEKYKIIVWNVHNENSIKRAYDKIIQRYKGVSRSDDTFTQYAIVCKEWRDKQKLNEVYTRKDRAFIITPSGQVFGGPYHETILKHDFPEMWNEMYDYCVEKDFGTEDLSISGMIQRKMYRRDYIKIICKTSGPLEIWIVLERMRKRSYNDIVKWANTYLNDVYDGDVHIMLDNNRQQYDCTLKELADDMMIERLLESKAEDEFQQIYDDLTDAHGYLADESNKWRYRNLARNVKDIRDDFEFIYSQTHMKESKLDYWQKRLEQLDVGTEEWFKAKSERDEILNHENNPIQLDYWGTCVEVGSHKSGDPWGGDATKMSQDLYPYDSFENTDNTGSNYSEISEGKFFEVAQEKALPDHEFIFLKRYDDTVYIAYDIDNDKHLIWW